jgi:hypothetical protein
MRRARRRRGPPDFGGGGGGGGGAAAREPHASRGHVARGRLRAHEQRRRRGRGHSPRVLPRAAVGVGVASESHAPTARPLVPARASAPVTPPLLLRRPVLAAPAGQPQALLQRIPWLRLGLQRPDRYGAPRLGSLPPAHPPRRQPLRRLTRDGPGAHAPTRASSFTPPWWRQGPVQHRSLNAASFFERRRGGPRGRRRAWSRHSWMLRTHACVSAVVSHCRVRPARRPSARPPRARGGRGARRGGPASGRRGGGSPERRRSAGAPRARGSWGGIAGGRARRARAPTPHPRGR